MTAVLPNPASVGPGITMQELVRAELKIQSSIAAISNAMENDLSYQAIQEQNSIIKQLFVELETKLQVCDEQFLSLCVLCAPIALLTSSYPVSFICKQEWKRKGEETLNQKDAEAIKEEVKRHQSQLAQYVSSASLFGLE
jgi:hypothetical protein